jgi:hypothetical protein
MKNILKHLENVVTDLPFFWHLIVAKEFFWNSDGQHINDEKILFCNIRLDKDL